ncbi:MAG: GspH/FimT family pseudopilin [Comamonadaceae bacterium]|nr:GspH/FimT family pseudopilin [Comamonadaceae bacterium]
MLSALPAARAARGLTLVELVVTLAMLSLLLALAAPAFGQWTRNAKVRTVGETLLTGVRLAQSEAVRRNRQVVFFLTSATACDSTITASGDGPYWAVRTVALATGDAVETVQCGALADIADGVAVTGPAAVCFNSMGRQVANAAPGVGTATRTLNAAGLSTYDIAITNGDRPLRVTVSLGGQARLCDPARVLNASQPDGCPA